MAFSSNTDRAVVAGLSKTAKSLEEVFEKFMDLLVEQTRYKQQKQIKQLAEYYKENGCLSSFQCDASVVLELQNSLNKYEIPYMKTTGSDGRPAFTIRDIDIDHVKDIQKMLLISKSNYYSVTTSKELRHAISESNYKDKTISYFKGLSEEEALYLQQQCTKMGKGFTLGYDKTKNGDVILSCHTPHLMDDNPNVMDFCQAYTEMAFAMYGPNAEIHKERAKQTMEFEQVVLKEVENIAEYENVYIFSVDDPTQFIEINKNGFSYNTVTYDENRKARIFTQYTANEQDYDYDSQYQRYITQLGSGKAYTTDHTVLDHHINTKHRIASPYAVEYSTEQKIRIKGERELSLKLDNIVKDKMRSATYLTDMRKKFDFYQKEVLGLINAVKDNGKIPDGYTHNDIQELKSICEEYGLDMNDYENSMETIKDTDLEISDSSSRKKVFEELEKSTIVLEEMNRVPEDSELEEELESEEPDISNS